ncbi:branched-chain amino acid aminotransferase [Acidisoma sp.]|uniref:branched-chain amino acid aminotransferase n=1 Tax=Acidisoma sp. TaxID=1872115 RepID=UPI0038D1A42C
MDAMNPVFVETPHGAVQPEAVRAAAIAKPGFGRVFTDHMVTLRFNAERGWHDGRIEPLTTLSFHPATVMLHYAQMIFEGLKAYRLPDGTAALFRPEMNARRMQRSAERLCMEPLPEALFLESVRALVRKDAAWIPAPDVGTLYLRPFLLGTETALGVHASTDYLYCLIASPVGSYFAGGAAPLTLWISETTSRAAPGGTGEAKCGGNYAASLTALAEAKREGCDQTIFLDAVEHRYVEELGGMNVFFVFDDGSLATPPLTGTILPGITRDSIIRLARDRGHEVREELYSIDQWAADAASGRLVEAFACGTAAVIAPIGRVRGRQHDITMGDGGAGPVTEALFTALTGIQRGELPDPYGWVEKLV